MIDPDKKVKRFQKLRAAIYHSKTHPKHFENEGGEFIDKESNQLINFNSEQVVKTVYPTEGHY